MTKHEIICDLCGAHAPLKYNGEHWLPPLNWTALYDDNKAEVTNTHLCPACHPKAKDKTK